jgi:alanyl-tRNA synthetase
MNILARMHTGEHVFVASLIRHNSGAKVEKIALDETESSVFVTCRGLDWEKVILSEKEANAIIKENRSVVIKEIPKEDAVNYPGLRIKLDRIKSDTVRVVEVLGHDVSACAGEHCRETGQIGNFLVTGFNSLGNDKYEIRFMVDVLDKLYEFSEIARKISAAAGADFSTLQKSIENLKTENEQLKHAVRDLQKKVPAQVASEKVGEITIYHASFADFEKRIVAEKARELAKYKAISCLFNIFPDTMHVFVSTSDDLKVNAAEIIRQLALALNGKGGGKGSSAMGAFSLGSEEKIIKEIKKIIQ